MQQLISDCVECECWNRLIYWRCCGLGTFQVDCSIIVRHSLPRQSSISCFIASTARSSHHNHCLIICRTSDVSFRLLYSALIICKLTPKMCLLTWISAHVLSLNSTNFRKSISTKSHRKGIFLPILLILFIMLMAFPNAYGMKRIGVSE